MSHQEPGVVTRHYDAGLWDESGPWIWLGAAKYRANNSLVITAGTDGLRVVLGTLAGGGWDSVAQLMGACLTVCTYI